ncbi:hypothetical protein TRVL_05977 [Trypanosoma vivax]|uniref:SKP1 component dimerisation domain-containing protein n=1 Tax=Trypanosoma vivax (strain Y486) TaxID=1055687 RepID=G0U875_TRYVY|nr:hypothetical protein TRVL_05977 [Trypanosoma vivax]CCC52085.1 conserved hypothetical protein [Trypanosoma vivax Y486]
MSDQLVVLIGSDGKRATVSRAVATQASMLLRELLDGREANTVTEYSSDNESPEGSLTIDDQSCDAADAIPTVELPFPYFTGALLERVCEHMMYHYGHSPLNRSTPSLELQGLQSSVADCGSVVSGASTCRSTMRDIPRPMTLPLSEYLDAFDQNFIKDWDEETTILMVKAATLFNYRELINLASARLAVYLSEKSVEGLRAFLGEEGDFDPEEELQLRKELERALD